MSWFTTMLRSSVGKKPIMAVTGFCFCVFLAIHLIGNLTLYWGKEYFNAYSEHLHSFGPLITVFELGLFSLGITHVILAIILFFENKNSRPIKYHFNTSAGGRSIGSATMPYSGTIILIFIIVHLSNFHFIDKSNTSIFNIVNNTFSHPGYVFFYLLSSLTAATHVSHGFWSTFQTLGVSHKKYTHIIKLLGILFSLALGIGFGFLPIYLLLLS